MQRLVTHDGGFHSDDVFAVAALQLHLGIDQIEVVRTRNQAVIEAAEWVTDVGGVYDPATKRFDHHQPGAPVRENGIPYAAFGLVWQEIGAAVAGSQTAADTIEASLVQPIDAGDNGHMLYELSGEVAPFELYNIIGLHAPAWGSETDMDDAFLDAVTTARGILERLITHVQAGETAKAYAQSCYDAAEDKRVVVCDQPISRGYFVDFPEVEFIVRPADRTEDTAWRAYTIPVDHHTFESRNIFPEAWAGLTDTELQAVSGIADAKFTHKDRFLFAATSREGALKAVTVVLAT